MTTSVAACIEYGNHNRAVKQELTSPMAETPLIQQSEMAAPSIGPPWTAFPHGLPSSHDDGYAIASSTDQPSLGWEPNSDPIINFYRPDATPEHLSETNYEHMTPWSNYTHMQTSNDFFMNTSQDSGTPRTFPVMDIGPDLAPYGNLGNTISPHVLYTECPPRSDPFQYSDDSGLYGPPEDHTNIMTSGLTNYANYFQEHDTPSSYRSTPTNEEDDEEEINEEKHEPYARTLYRCLKEAPEHTMVLREIYEWFKNNTPRGKESHEKGWQNSIRHNLSMNHAFEKIENTGTNEPSRRGYQWRLTEQALREGCVQSTTRYRNKQPNKRGGKNPAPDINRQISGQRGGRMARHSANARRSERLRESQKVLRQYTHGLGSRAYLADEQSITSRHAISHTPFSPSNGLAMMRDGNVQNPGSTASSPYNIYEPPAYEWPQHNQQHSVPPASGVIQHEQYMATSNPHTPAAQDTPEIIWRAHGDGIFCDSSDATSTTPATPSSFEGAEIPHGLFGFASNGDCRL